MSPFEYLSVLISVIVGLGVSHLLTSLARLIQRRHEVKLHAPTLLWMATLFVVQIQIWWAFYNARQDSNWNFFSFLAALVIPVLGYLLCYLIVPGLEAEGVDLKASFHANRPWFFGLAALAFVFSFEADLVSTGIPLNLNTAFRVVFILLLLAAMRVRSDRYHVLNAAVGLALFCAYVFAEFLRLV